MAGKSTPPPAPPAPPAPPEEGGKAKGGYRAVSPVRANKTDFAIGDTVTGLSDKQVTELLGLNVIEKK